MILKRNFYYQIKPENELPYELAFRSDFSGGTGNSNFCVVETKTMNGSVVVIRHKTLDQREIRKLFGAKPTERLVLK